MNKIVKVLMERDNLSEDDARDAVLDAQAEAIECGDPEEILRTDLGLEPDYVFDLLEFS